MHKEEVALRPTMRLQGLVEGVNRKCGPKYMDTLMLSSSAALKPHSLIIEQEEMGVVL
jgi:hypothetical protein